MTSFNHTTKLNSSWVPSPLRSVITLPSLVIIDIIVVEDIMGLVCHVEILKFEITAYDLDKSINLED